MRYVLKVRTIEGTLAPLRAEHVEYSEFGLACADAELFASIEGAPVFVIGDMDETRHVAYGHYAKGAK